MMMGALRVNIPTMLRQRRTDESRQNSDGRSISLSSVFEGVGAHQAGKINDDKLDWSLNNTVARPAAPAPACSRRTR